MPNNNPNINTSNSQRSRVLRHLQAGNSLTALQALNYFGCARLAARIGELIDAGWPIQSRAIRITNRDGKLVTVSEYYLSANDSAAAGAAA
jgi:hypothetical protein